MFLRLFVSVGRSIDFVDRYFLVGDIIILLRDVYCKKCHLF